MICEGCSFRASLIRRMVLGCGLVVAPHSIAEIVARRMVLSVLSVSSS